MNTSKTIPYDFDANLRDWVDQHEREDYAHVTRLLEDDLREGRLSRRYTGGLRYGIDPEIDRVIDDDWTEHDAKLRRGE